MLGYILVPREWKWNLIFVREPTRERPRGVRGSGSPPGKTRGGSAGEPPREIPGGGPYIRFRNPHKTSPQVQNPFN